jgi:hypothetical protein
MRIKKWRLDYLKEPIILGITLSRKEWTILLENVLNELEDKDKEITMLMELER